MGKHAECNENLNIKFATFRDTQSQISRPTAAAVAGKKYPVLYSKIVIVNLSVFATWLLDRTSAPC